MSVLNGTGSASGPIAAEYTQDELWTEFGFGILVCVVVVLVCYVFAATWDAIDMARVRYMREKLQKDAGYKRNFVSAFLKELMDSTNSLFARVVDVVDTLLGITVIAIFITRTYQQDISSTVDVVEGLIGAFFGIEFIIDFLVAESRQKRSFVMRPSTVLHLVSMTFNFLVLVDGFEGIHRAPGYASLSYLRVALVYMRWVKIDAQWLAPSNLVGDVTRHLIVMAFSVFTLVVIFAATVMTLENLGDPTALSETFTDEEEGRWTFYLAAYFVFVTISTVGYGDYSPSSVLGRLAVVCFIVGGIIYFTVQTGRLVEIVQEEGAGSGRFVNPSDTAHVIVVGDLTPTLVKDFLAEFYHSDHEGARLNMRVVILTSDYSSDVKRFLNNDPANRDRVTYLKGMAFNYDDLTKRCQGKKARAVFIVSHKFSQDDRPNVLRALAIKRYLPGVAVYVVLNQTANLSLLTAAGVPVDNVCRIDELKLGLLAQNTITPGTSTLVTNLLGSNEIPDLPTTSASEMAAAQAEAAAAAGSGAPVAIRKRWREEYVVGLGQEIYEMEVPPGLYGKTFAEAAREVYRKSLAFFEDPARCPPEVDPTYTPGIAMFGVAKGAARRAGRAAGTVTAPQEYLFDLADKYLLKRHDTMFVLGEDMAGINEALVDLMPPDYRPSASFRDNPLDTGEDYFPVEDEDVSEADSSRAREVVSSLLKVKEDARVFQEEQAFATALANIDGDVTRVVGSARTIRSARGSSTVRSHTVAELLRKEAFADAETHGDGLILDTAPPDGEDPSSPVGSRAGALEASGVLKFNAKEEAVTPVPPPSDISDHILVCGAGWIRWLPLFLKPLRQSSKRPVVVLDDEESPAWWASVAACSQQGHEGDDDAAGGAGGPSGDGEAKEREIDIFYVRGSSLDPRDLVRARIMHAHRVVILGARPTSQPSDSALYFADTDATFTTMIVENIFAPYNHKLLFGTTTEFLHDPNVKFLQSAAEIAAHDASHTQDDQPAARLDGQTSVAAEMADMERRKRSMAARRPTLAGAAADIVAEGTAVPRHVWSELTHPDDDTKMDPASWSFEFSNRYAAGRVFASGSVTSTLVQAFYNPCVMSVAHLFADGKHITIRHAEIPKAYHGCAYLDVYMWAVTTLKMAPLGLYRDKRAASDATLPYVFANPPARAIVHPGDVLFVVHRGFGHAARSHVTSRWRSAVTKVGRASVTARTVSAPAMAAAAGAAAAAAPHLDLSPVEAPSSLAAGKDTI